MLTLVHIKVLVEGQRAASILERVSDELGSAPDRSLPRTAQFTLDGYESASDAIAAVRAALDLDPQWREVLLLREPPRV